MAKLGEPSILQNIILLYLRLNSISIVVVFRRHLWQDGKLCLDLYLEWKFVWIFYSFVSAGLFTPKTTWKRVVRSRSQTIHEQRGKYSTHHVINELRNLNQWLVEVLTAIDISPWSRPHHNMPWFRMSETLIVYCWCVIPFLTVYLMLTKQYGRRKVSLLQCLHLCAFTMELLYLIYAQIVLINSTQLEVNYVQKWIKYWHVEMFELSVFTQQQIMIIAVV